MTMSSHGDCPYSQSNNRKEKTHDGTKVLSKSLVSSTSLAFELAKENCPAFRDRVSGKLSCPFRDSQDADNLKEVMSRVPKSHLIDDTSKVSSSNFLLALDHIHLVSKSLTNIESKEKKKYMFDGTCPFKSYYRAPQDKLSTQSYVRAIESLSLASIIADMAENMDTDFSEGDRGNTLGEKSNLSDALRKGTQKSHKAAENVTFVKKFIRGDIQRELYIKLISNLYFVYVNLETLLDHYGPTYFPTLHKPEQLRRTECLEADLQFFLGDAWVTLIKPSDATKEYIYRLHQVASDEPLLLLAHAYTRYLGDLSGGRTLQRVARRALQLPKKQQSGSLEGMGDGAIKFQDGLRFYEFENIASAKEFKISYRQALDSMDLKSSDMIQKIVGEANVAFVLNMRIFEELDVISGDMDPSNIRSLSDALAHLESFNKEHRDRGSTMFLSDSSKCPFMVHQDPKKNTGDLNGINNESRCPWPFVFFHDPAQGIRDFQTWVVLAFFLCLLFHLRIESI